MECPICFVKFDSKYKVPRNIGCGHTFCHECITVMVQKNNHTCPICRKGFEKKRSADNYPKCFALLQLADAKEQDDKKCQLICSDCNIKECSRCASFSKQLIIENMTLQGSGVDSGTNASSEGIGFSNTSPTQTRKSHAAPSPHPGATSRRKG